VISDTRKEEKYNKVIESWDEEDDGRRDKAKESR